MRRKIHLSIMQFSIILAIAILTTTITVLAASGTTDATNAPGLTASYTLEDIYQRLRNGNAGSQSTFNEPAVAPEIGSMHTLNDIMAAAPALDNTNGATANQVLQGQSFWGLTNSQWGEQTGVRQGGCVCNGHMVGDSGTRWCDNENGTITDMHNECLIWTKNASCIPRQNWVNANIEAGIIESGDCGISDGSYYYQWRLPTLMELIEMQAGVDKVFSTNMQGFTGVQSDFYYWSSSTFPILAYNTAYASDFGSGSYGADSKNSSNYVWAVRNY